MGQGGAKVAERYRRGYAPQGPKRWASALTHARFRRTISRPEERLALARHTRATTRRRATRAHAQHGLTARSEAPAGGGGGGAAAPKPKEGPHTPWVGAEPATKSDTYYGASGGNTRPRRRLDGTAGTAGSPREPRRRRGGGGGGAAAPKPMENPHTPWVGAEPATRKASSTSAPRAVNPGRTAAATARPARRARRAKRSTGGAAAAAEPRRRGLKKVRTRLGSARNQPREERHLLRCLGR